MRKTFNIQTADPSWHPCLQEALLEMDPEYLENLETSSDWLPGHDNIFRAFSVPLNQIHYILLGESPYPRAHSANGYAFWDAAVSDLWCPTGLTKSVNRATSLRNMIKMMLVAEGLLDSSRTTQEHIASLDKTGLIKTNSQLFEGLLSRGFLLLNATPVLRAGRVREDANAWQPFVHRVLAFIAAHRPNTQIILLGRIAATLSQLPDSFARFTAEHPYNLSFISNPSVLDFFRPLSLLRPIPDTIKLTSNAAK